MFKASELLNHNFETKITLEIELQITDKIEIRFNFHCLILPKENSLGGVNKISYFYHVMPIGLTNEII